MNQIITETHFEKTNLSLTQRIKKELDILSELPLSSKFSLNYENSLAKNFLDRNLIREVYTDRNYISNTSLTAYDKTLKGNIYHGIYNTICNIKSLF